MFVTVGYCDDPDTESAGARAALEALAQADRSDPCDLVLLFATARHDPRFLRSVVAATVGPAAVIVGGGAIGAITNDRFGYAGDQVGLALVWLDDIGCELQIEGGIVDNEENAGILLGRALSARGLRRDTASILFYDAIDRSRGDLHLNLATPLLGGLEEGLGFLPDNLVGAGLQADYENTPYPLWTGHDTRHQCAMMLSFSEALRIDSVIMHGCKPAGKTYTVTKADGQTILEIDGRPALSYMESRLQPSLPASAFPFFMIFGVNRGEPDEPFNEKHYANRLCLAIDRPRSGIVMFEPDMVAGTRFQVMYRSLDLDYIPPRVDALFAAVTEAGRRPAFAFYIDCAGRAARYGAELEDAVVVQRSVGGRVPLLGIYSGVEIAPILGRPRTLDWTGVFCLFSRAI